MALQRRQTVEVRGLQQGSDGFQIQAQFPVEENELEPVRLLGAVEPVACLRNLPGLEKAFLVVPAQSPGRDSGQVCQSFDGILHGYPS